MENNGREKGSNRREGRKERKGKERKGKERKPEDFILACNRSS
jgi:hypothetical protein